MPPVSGAWEPYEKYAGQGCGLIEKIDLKEGDGPAILSSNRRSVPLPFGAMPLQQQPGR